MRTIYNASKTDYVMINIHYLRANNPMKLNIDACLSFLGKHALFFVIGTGVLQIISVILFVYNLMTGVDIDQLILASVVMFFAILLFGLAKYAVKIRVLEDSGGPEAYLRQPLRWPLPQSFIDEIEKCGVRNEFDAWASKQEKPLTKGQFDDGLAEAIKTAYKLPAGEDLPDSVVLKLFVYRHGAPILKWLSIGSVLLCGLLAVILFNSQNTFAEGAPFIFGALFLTSVFNVLRKIFQVRAKDIILNRTMTVEQVAALMSLAFQLNVHDEFCRYLRSSACPNTVKEAHDWIINKAQGYNIKDSTFLG